jgi:uncharacterized surface protein with fasciclin (FAS1) repeats
MAVETYRDLNILEAAKKAEKFTTLIAAINAADLNETLTKGSFTVFAPTDDAFKNLPAGTLEMLLKPENKEKLVQILKYHVISGSVKSPDVIKVDNIETVEGSKIQIMRRNNDVLINDAKIVMVDIYTKNGIIHVIDKVLMPQ